MTKKEELILKIISLAEERMRLIMDQSRQDVDWKGINERINSIPLEVEALKKELMSLKEEDEATKELSMLTVEETCNLFNCNRNILQVYKEIGILRPIKTGKRYMYSKDEIRRFQITYAGMDVSNKVKAIEAYKKVTAGTVTMN